MFASKLVTKGVSAHNGLWMHPSICLTSKLTNCLFFNTQHFMLEYSMHGVPFLFTGNKLRVEVLHRLFVTAKTCKIVSGCCGSVGGCYLLPPESPCRRPVFILSTVADISG